MEVWGYAPNSISQKKSPLEVGFYNSRTWPWQKTSRGCIVSNSQSEIRLKLFSNDDIMRGSSAVNPNAREFLVIRIGGQEILKFCVSFFHNHDWRRHSKSNFKLRLAKERFRRRESGWYNRTGALIKPPKQERVIFIFVATFIAALGPTSFGYCLGYSSSALQDLQSKPHKDPLYLSPEQGSWFSVNILKFSSFFKKTSWAQNFARSLTKPQETHTLCVCCIMVSSEI